MSISSSAMPNSQPPLYEWLVISLWKLSGSWPVSVAVAKNASLAATYCFSYWSGRVLFGNRAGAALLALSLLFMPQIVWQSQITLSHSVLAVAASAALLTSLVLLIERRSIPRFIGLGFALGAALLSKYNVLILIAGLAGAFASNSRSTPSSGEQRTCPQRIDRNRDCRRRMRSGPSRTSKRAPPACQSLRRSMAPDSTCRFWALTAWTSSLSGSPRRPFFWRSSGWSRGGFPATKWMCLNSPTPVCFLAVLPAVHWRSGSLCALSPCFWTMCITSMSAISRRSSCSCRSGWGFASRSPTGRMRSEGSC